MLNQIANSEFELFFDLKIDGEFVIPAPGSLLLTIRDENFVAIPGYDSKVLPNTLINRVQTTVTSAGTQLPVGKTLSIRHVELKFTSDQGGPGLVKTQYRVIEPMPVQVGPQEVRNTLGISYQELPDAELDIFQSYISLSKKKAGFATALKSGTVAEIYANQILLYTEALRIAPSLRARILKQEEKDNALYIRFLMDFDALKAELEGALKDAEDNLDEELGQNETVGTTLLVVTQPIDRVTGV